MTIAERLEPRRLLAIDLVPISATVAGEYFVTGETLNITVSLRNVGTSNTVLPVTGIVVLSVDGGFGNTDDTFLGEFNLGAIAGQKTVSTTIRPSLPAVANVRYRLGVRLDPLNYINETNEANNFSVTNVAQFEKVPQLAADTVVGIAGDDVIELSENSGGLLLLYNGTYYKRTGSLATPLTVFLGTGDDQFTADNRLTTPLFVTGEGGNDTILGGAGGDELSGANGKDVILGGDGDDYLLGGASNDRLFGDNGSDTASGGGGNDYLYGSLGLNWLIGGAGNDKLFARGNIGAIDTVSGNAGIDYAEFDPGDIVSSIESVG